MKKALAEVIAGVIPSQMERNRMRGVLRYGLFRAMKLNRRMKRDTSVPQYYLSVCAIAKNEGRYIKEWIDYHHSMGVEKFYLYDNESTDNTREVLDPYIKSGLVDYTYFPGKKQQLPAYDDCFERHRLETRWLAVLDLDEFVVPVRDKNIPDFLRGLEKYPVVEINWLIYGSSGLKEYDPRPVMERFKCHSLPDYSVNTHIKSIVDPRRVCTMTGCHEAARLRGKSVDSHGNILKKNFFHRPPQQDIIRINHYAVKSYGEFLDKRARGRARTESIRDLSYFETYDKNDICEP